MQLYRNILVTMDCSAVDDAIVRHVALLAKQNEARVTLLHVIHSHTLDQDRSLREKATRTLKRQLEKLQAQGVDACYKLRSGEPEEEIVAEVDECDYDLVAMATHGHTLMVGVLLGSVARSLRKKIRLPLLLIKGDS